MNQKFILRFPFVLTPGKEISLVDGSRKIESKGLNFSIDKKSSYYIIEVEGFNTEEDAARFIKHLWGGLMWVLLEGDISFDVSALDPQTVVYSKNPIQASKNISESCGNKTFKPVDGIIEEGKPAIYSNAKRNIRILTGFSPSVVISTPTNIYFKHLIEGISFPNISNIAGNERIKTALELYAASSSEISINAKFLTLIMVLEVLSVRKKRAKLAQNLIRKWEIEIETQKNQSATNEKDKDELEALEREIIFRKEESIRSSIRRTVFQILDEQMETDAHDIAGQAKRLYDTRSRLIHEGKLPKKELDLALQKAREIVPRVLKAKFRQIASLDSR